MTSEKINGIEFTRVKNDINGNPRYVVHFLDLLNQSEIDGEGMGESYVYDVQPKQLEIAKKRANSLGGRKYTGKNFGGGFVFQSYNIRRLSEMLNELKA